MSLVGANSGRSFFTLSGVVVKDSRLPPLPEIKSKQLSQQVFTRNAGHKHTFQAPDGDASADNEE
jgi:hypothetical protein